MTLVHEEIKYLSVLYVTFNTFLKESVPIPLCHNKIMLLHDMHIWHVCTQYCN